MSEGSDAGRGSRAPGTGRARGKGEASGAGATKDARRTRIPDSASPPYAPHEVPWYVDGVAFECTACGKCCHNHGEGYEYVYSTIAERRAIATRLGVSLRAFERDFCERAPGGLSFGSRGDACIFLEDGRCSIYDLRPKQCATFPFWPELMEDRAAWERDVASFCPGVGQGPVHDFDEIRRRLRAASP